MACFLAPAVAAIIATGIKKKIPARYHGQWLRTMLWGGVMMLIIEHFAHGEIRLRPPFLTAAENYTDFVVMLEEIATVGGLMTVAIVIVWLAMVLIANTVTKARQKKISTILS